MASCSYVHILSKMVRGDLAYAKLPLPEPLTLRGAEATVAPLSGEAVLDTHSLAITTDAELTIFKALEAIKATTDRVGGVLNGLPIELDLNSIQIGAGRITFHFFSLTTAPPTGVQPYELYIDLI
jgi:hypothetical protein